MSVPLSAPSSGLPPQAGRWVEVLLRIDKLAGGGFA